MERTVVALFDDVNTAQQAVNELINNGFDRNHISVVRTNDTRTSVASGSTTTDYEAGAGGAAAGAGIGGVLGGMAGLLVGLGVLAIPGIGPVIAAGPVAAALAGAGIGAATGGIIGALTDAGIPENQAGYYAEGIRRGGTLVTVRTNDDHVNHAVQIFDRYSPVDVNQRASEWRSSGWTGFDANSSVASGTYAGASSRYEDFENDFRNDWKARYGSSGYGFERYQPAYRYGYESRSRYHGRNWSDAERDVRSDWERQHPNERWEDFKDSIRTGWEKFKGEVRETGRDLDRSMDRMGDRMSDTTRDMRHDTERAYDRTTGHMSRNFDMYDNDFRSNWEQSYRTRGIAYSRYQPAYHYGYDLAHNDRYRGRSWHEIENEARRDWEMQHPSDKWEDFKEAVQHAWQRVRADVRDALD